MADGKTTETPPTYTLESFYVGNRYHFITFRHMHLSDGRVVLHSELYDARGPIEDFLYEVVERQDAMNSARTMVEDAEEYLQSLGVTLEFGTAGEFLNLLYEELYHRLH